MKPEILLGSDGKRVPSLYHLYVGGGEPSPSWQDRMTVLPVVTEDGILHKGGDGGTAGYNIQISARLQVKFTSEYKFYGSGVIWVDYKWKYEFAECNYEEFLPRTVSFTPLSPYLPLPDTSQSYAPLSLRVTLENLRLLPYIVTRLEYGAVEEFQHYE